MGLTNTENLRDEIEWGFRNYVDGVKIRTKNNLNDSAVNGEGFFRNFLNLLYEFNLNKDRIESAYNETIDLHDPERKICVQVTARNDKSKVDITIQQFTQRRKYELYTQLHFVIIDREKDFDYDLNKLSDYGVKIIFHDYCTIFKTLKDNFDSYEKIKPVYSFIISELNPDIVKEKSAMNSEKSHEEKQVVKDTIKSHVVDEILQSLKVFDGFRCIFPRTVAQLPIFNKKDSYYDSYSHYCLKTSNGAIHDLLQKVEISNYALIIKDPSLEPYANKIKEIFSILNNSLIRCICYREKYTEIKHHNINIIPFDPTCGCNYCRFFKFDIKPLFSELKGKAISHSTNNVTALGEGFYLCKIGEHIKGWQVFHSIVKRCLEKSNSAVYFLAQYNIKQIRGFVDSPWWKSESEQILHKIDNVDLNGILCSHPSQSQLRDELVKVKEKYFLYQCRKVIEELASCYKGHS